MGKGRTPTSRALYGLLPQYLVNLEVSRCRLLAFLGDHADYTGGSASKEVAPIGETMLD